VKEQGSPFNLEFNVPDDPQKMIREKVVAAQQGGDVTQPMGGAESKVEAEPPSMDKMLRDQAYRHRLQIDHFDKQIAATPVGVDRDLLELNKLETVYMFNQNQDAFVGSSSPSTKTISAKQVMEKRIDDINRKYGQSIKAPVYPSVGEQVGEDILQ
jgi:hypothetical protein